MNLTLKKAIFLAVFATIMTPIFALQSGDNASNVTTRWKNYKSFQAKYNSIDTRNKDKLKVIIFAQPTSEEFKVYLPIIENLGNQKSINLAVIANIDSDVDMFLKNNREFPFPITADRVATNNYISGSMIYPKAYVINYQNKIIWDGEIMDLPEMISTFQAGKFNLEDNVKISKQLREIQLAIRNGDDRRADRATKTILAIDPANSAALRMRLFMFENTNRYIEAYNLLAQQIKKSPNTPKLYMLMLDLAIKNPIVAEKSIDIMNEFATRNIGEFRDKLMFAMLLLNSFENNIEIIKSSQILLDNTKNELANQPKQNQAMFYNIKALLCYKICKIDLAIENQEKAVKLDNSEDLENQLKFFQELKNQFN